MIVTKDARRALLIDSDMDTQDDTPLTECHYSMKQRTWFFSKVMEWEPDVFFLSDTHK